MEKRYLVYKSWNGQIHTSIEYGNHTDGEGKRKDNNELKRFEIKEYHTHDELSLSHLKLLYPLEEANEKTVNP